MTKASYVAAFQPTTKKGPSLTPIKIIRFSTGPVAHLTRDEAVALVASLQEAITAATTTDERTTACVRAQEASKAGFVQHVNRTEAGGFTVCDWYDSDTTVASFENGRAL